MGATSNYPSSLDTTSTLPADISATAALNSPNHAQMHERYNDAIIEIEEKVGIGDTTPTAGAVLIGTGTGASAWDTTPTFVGDVTIPEGDLILGSTAVTSTAAEINVLDGVTGGTVTASKALVVDGNKDLASLRNVTLTGELVAATLDISGDVDIDGTTNLDVVDIDGAVNLSANLAFTGTLSGSNSIPVVAYSHGGAASVASHQVNDTPQIFVCTGTPTTNLTDGDIWFDIS